MSLAAAPPRAGLIWRAATVLCLAALLAACSSTPQRDGPPADPPPDLIDRPDATPRIEPIRSGGPNKPYVVLGQAYTPVTSDEAMVQSGLASWYGRKFHGNPTASGEIYDMYAMTAAHRTMPLPSYALVRNPANGREVVVRVNDRGPFHAERIIDLSYAAALKLGILRGVTPVQVQRLTNEDIRTERWRGDTEPLQAAAPLPQPQPPATEAVATAPATPASPAPVAAMAAPTSTAVDTAANDAPLYWVQLGAFRQRQGANDLRRQLMRELAWLEPWLAVFDDSALFRLQAGPFATRGEAMRAAERIRGAARMQPLVVQRP